MENQAKPINPALIPLLVIGGILLVLVVAIVIAKSRNSDPTSDSATQPAATEAPAPTFGMEQNDQEGYNKIPWGTSYREFVKQTRAASTVPATPLLDCTRKIFALAEEQGRHDQDIAAMIEVIEALR